MIRILGQDQKELAGFVYEYKSYFLSWWLEKYIGVQRNNDTNGLSFPKNQLVAQVLYVSEYGR